MKHSRRRACAAYQEFQIRKEDEDLIKKNIEEDTTLTTRSNHSPTEVVHLLELIEIINSDFISKSLISQQRKTKLRQEVLNQLKSSAAPTKPPEIMTPSKTKRPKKPLKQKKPNSKSKSLKDPEFLLPKSSVRSYRRAKGSAQV